MFRNPARPTTTSTFVATFLMCFVVFFVVHSGVGFQSQPPAGDSLNEGASGTDAAGGVGGSGPRG